MDLGVSVSLDGTEDLYTPLLGEQTVTTYSQCFQRMVNTVPFRQYFLSGDTMGLEEEDF